MARKGILTGGLETNNRRKETAKPQPRGTVGALQSSLSKLQENAVQDIDPTLIDDAGFEDRLGFDYHAHNRLKDSLKAYGQQVPVLLRPHETRRGRFQIVYGRRRLKALKELGLPVKAMVRQLDDEALVMAQGQENTARQDLSFAEKACFATQLQSAGYERATIADALSTDLPMLSRMLKVGGAFPITLFKAIGPAPGIGRDRWMQLVKVAEDPPARARALSQINQPGFAGNSSDDRFEMVLAKAAKAPDAKPPAPARPRPLRAPDGAALGNIRQSRKAVTLNISGPFGAWISDQAEDLIQELHDRWQKDRSEDTGS